MKTKKLTTLELYWYIIGSAIGSGLFVLLPIAIGYTGRSAMLAILVAGAVRLTTDIFSITMASMFPLRGGNYSQVSYWLPPILAGVYGLIWIIQSLTMSAYATSAVSYSASIFPGIAQYSKLIAIGIVTFFFILNYFGTKFGAKIQGAMTVLLLACLAAFVAFGLPHVNTKELITDNFFLAGLPGFSAALAMCSWATEGILTTAAAMSTEMDNPTRQVPKAMVGGVIMIVSIYFLIITVAVGVLPIEDVAFQDLTVVAQHIFPRGMFIVFVFGGAVIALLTSLMGSVTAFRYPFEQLAEEGWLPPVFKKRTSNGWPVVGMVVMFFMVLIPVVFDISFDKIISYTSFPGTFLVLYVNLRCMSLPKKYPELWKKSFMGKIPLPLYYALCVLGAAGTGYMAYCYCADMGVKDVMFMLLLTLAMLSYSWYCLKSKHVSPAYLEEQKEAIVAEITEYERTHQN